jgi:hypothetical protein
MAAQPEHSNHGITTYPFARDETLFVCAVLVGTAGAIVSRQLLLPLVGAVSAGNAALAVATTLTGAAHARLVHRKSFRALMPQVLASAPLAYAAMRAVHTLLD